MHSYLSCVVFGLLCLINLYRSQVVQWNYGALGPDVWKDFFPACGGSSQSPINIKTACTTFKSFEPFLFSSGYNLTQDFTLTNTGHMINAVQTNTTAFSLQLTGGGLSGTFTLDNFHLHWGENYNSGSEHQV
jgi:carbonic anhydrase